MRLPQSLHSFAMTNSNTQDVGINEGGHWSLVVGI